MDTLQRYTKAGIADFHSIYAQIDPMYSLISEEPYQRDKARFLQRLSLHLYLLM